MHRIAVLITCFNRREKTLQCLRLISSQKTRPNIETNVFIVDGGSSDGTPEAIQKAFPKVKVKVEEGLYWAGGMREAWKMAADEGDYDYYLLLFGIQIDIVRNIFLAQWQLLFNNRMSSLMNIYHIRLVDYRTDIVVFLCRLGKT